MFKRQQLLYTNTFIFAGQKINYDIIGKGKPLVFVHGAFTHDCFSNVPKQLSESYTIYLLHLPGFGASDSVTARHDTNLFAQVLDRFIEKLSLKKAPIIAVSLGTVVTIKAAALGSIHGPLILIGVPGKVTGLLLRLVQFVPLCVLRYLGQTEFGRKKLIMPAMKENIASGSEETITAILSHTDPRSVVDIDYLKEIEKELPIAMKKVKNKIIFIYGENDPLKYTTAHLFKSYIELPGIDHDACSDTTLATRIKSLL